MAKKKTTTKKAVKTVYDLKEESVEEVQELKEQYMPIFQKKKTN